MTKRKGLCLLASLLAGVAALVLSGLLRVTYTGHHEGLFLLRQRVGYGWELKDDLFLGEGPRLLAKLQLKRPVDVPLRPGVSFLDLQWDERQGTGFVHSTLEDGTALQFFFSRFLDDAGLATRGLFVGGGLPAAVVDEHSPRANDTGIAYFDGRRWLHLWCNANEGIGSGRTRSGTIYPSSWDFLGSRVLLHSRDKIVLASEHAVVLDGAPLHIMRRAYFSSGDRYFKLSIRIRNEGSAPVSYYYLYGDEPWLGDYGSASGNLGWISDGIVEQEGAVDARRHDYAGMVDIDSGAVNFIEWLGGLRPEIVYFSNSQGRFSPAERQVPLASNERFLGLVWGPRVLPPGKTEAIFLAIGMGRLDPVSGRPSKPPVTLYTPLD